MDVDQVAADFAKVFERNGWVWGTGRILGRVWEGSELRDALTEVETPTAKQVAAAIRELVEALRTNEG